MKPGLCPDMPVYVGDWLSSTSITLMTPAEEGAYWRLLCHAWNSADCSLPSDPVALAALSRLGPAWEQGSGAKILACFEQDADKPDRIFNAKQRAIRSAQESRVYKAKGKGIMAARSRWDKRNKDAQAMHEQCSSNAGASSKHMLQDASSPVSPLPLQRESSADRPSLEEIKAYAQTIGLAEWKAVDWFNEMEGGGWLDYIHRPIQDWRAVLNRVRSKWEADGRPTGPPSRRAAVTRNQSTTRNQGIAGVDEMAERIRRKAEEQTP